MGKLTVGKVRALMIPGRYGDGETLHLSVSPRETKSWVQRVVINGRRHDIGLGGWPVVSLATARERAFNNRVAIAHGRDPLAEKRKGKALTFREAADRTFKANKARWRRSGTADDWSAAMRKYVYPAFGDRPVDQISRDDVLRVLTPVWTSKPALARKLRQRIRGVLELAMAHGHVDANMAGDGIDGALPPMPSVKEHYRALPYQEVWAALDAIEGSLRASPAVRACIRFVVLTACRSGEARGATWGEIDVDARLWRIPASRMKMGRPHVVPLSDAALAVLDKARALTDGGDLVFPSPRGVVMGSNKLSHPMTELNLAGTPHGLRASFATWAEERDYRGIAIDLCLAHDKKSATTKAYMRHDFWIERVALMEAWGRMVEGREQQAEIVELAAHRT